MLKQKRYPTKKTLNLMLAEKSSLRPTRSIPAVALVLLVAILFGKFAVADRLMAASRAEAAAQSLEQQLQSAQTELLGYDTVQAEYARYFSDALGTPAEEMPLDCMEVLKLLNRQLASRVSVSSLNFTGNTITLQISGAGLSEASDLIADLSGEPSVASVEISTANTGVSGLGSGTNMMMTITLQEVTG